MGAAPGASAVCSEGDKVARQQRASVQPFYRVTLQLEFHIRERRSDGNNQKECVAVRVFQDLKALFFISHTPYLHI
jgi:hypothetical protein